MTGIIIIFSAIVLLLAYVIYEFTCERKIIKEQKNVNLKENTKHGIETPEESKIIMKRDFRNGKWVEKIYKYMFK